MKNFINERIEIEFQFYFSLCESLRNCIRYSTKEDFECMYKNVDPKDFHLNFHIYYWAIETECFSLLDPFIQKNIAYKNSIETKYYEYRMMNQPQCSLYGIIILKTFNNWRDSVILWYNDFIEKRTTKTLYLYGKADTGKSFLIFSLFCNIKFLNFQFAYYF